MAAGTSTAAARSVARAGSGGRRGLPPADRAHRYPADLVRVGLGLAAFGIGFLLAQQGELSLFERDLFRLVNDLSGLILPLVWAVMQLGNVVAVPVLAGLAAARRRWRMARDLLVSGVLAYVTADLVKSVVGRERPAGFPVDAILRDGNISGIGFISGHSAVAAALATAASPYMSRRARRTVWALAWSVALARVYVGAHLPLDIVGGVAAGWAIGSLVHWIFGVPRWHPRADRVARMLERFGLPVQHVSEADVRARSSHPFEAVDGSGRRVYVKVLDPDRFERDWLYRLYRLVVARDIKDADAVAPLGRQAEHEAVAALTARQRGVRVPAVVLARGTDRGAVVVQEFVEARPLDELTPEELTPALLTEIWRQVGLLHDARVAHHDLVTSSVLVDSASRPWIVDFGNAETGADDESLAGDLAELMASLALRLDADVVARSAVAALGAATVAQALPGLAPLSLSAVTRTELRGRAGRLSVLRRAVRGRVGVPAPERLASAPPGALARLAVAVGAGTILIGVPLLAGAPQVAEVVELDGWRWLGGAVILALLARVAGAAAALFTVDRRVAVGRTFGATVVAEGATLLHGRAGWRRAAARFLERAGVLPEPAGRAVRSFSVGILAASALVAAVLLVLGAVEGYLTDWTVPDALVPAVLLGSAAWLLVLAGQTLAARRSTPAAAAGAAAGAGAAAERPWQRRPHLPPGRWSGLLGWAAVGIVLEGAALAAVLHGVGADLPLLTTASVYAGLRLLWTAVPLTGVPGAADVTLLLGLTALGAPLAAACAAVTAFRLLTFWIPAGLGALLTLRFEHRLVL